MTTQPFSAKLDSARGHTKFSTGTKSFLGCSKRSDWPGQMVFRPFPARSPRKEGGNQSREQTKSDDWRQTSRGKKKTISGGDGGAEGEGAWRGRESEGGGG